MTQKKIFETECGGRSLRKVDKWKRKICQYQFIKAGRMEGVLSYRNGGKYSWRCSTAWNQARSMKKQLSNSCRGVNVYRVGWCSWANFRALESRISAPRLSALTIVGELYDVVRKYAWISTKNANKPSVLHYISVFQLLHLSRWIVSGSINFARPCCFY